jgi:hypothetical protein
MRGRPAVALVLQGLQGVDEGARCHLPPLPDTNQHVLIGGIGPADPFQGRPGRTLLLGSRANRIFALFTEWIHLVEADPLRGQNLRS